MRERSTGPLAPDGPTSDDGPADPETRWAKGIMVLLVYALMLFAAAGSLAWYADIARLDGFSEMARRVFTTYIVPFEVLGFLLLAALLGALYLAAREGMRS
jgi:NADH:ubiquinone oxidoreductase subunit 6 (subunit J)